MSSVKNFLRDVGYFGVGAAALLAEAGSKAVNSLVRKGETTLRENQDAVDDLKRKARDLGSKVKTAAEKATRKPAAPVDAASMTPEERAELRRQLDEADAAWEAADPCPDCSEDEICPDCAEEEPCPDCEAPAEPAEEADEPEMPAAAEAPEEDDPENTVNG